ncbi:MAG: hypothetical protein ACTSYC_00905 [Promethearchaeota archaeon]
MSLIKNLANLYGNKNAKENSIKLDVSKKYAMIRNTRLTGSKT